MWLSKDFSLLLPWFLYITRLALFLGVCTGGELSESDFLIKFIQGVDPINSLGINFNGVLPDHCSDRWMGVRCNLEENSITEIILENLNLSGVIDTDSLCKLPSLRILNLAKNHIQGSIPDSISDCVSITHLNLSSNLLHGRVPASLSSMKNLRSLDVSNNNLSGPVPNCVQTVKDNLITINHAESNGSDAMPSASDDSNLRPPGAPSSNDDPSKVASKSAPFFLVAACVMLFVVIIKKKGRKEAKKSQECLKDCLRESPSPIKILIADAKEDSEQEQKQPELVFFVEEQEWFKLEELLASAADLQGQNLCSSLYKVKLKNNDTFAVKRLKGLQVSAEEFGRTMTRVGKLKHSNLLPLVAYHSSNYDKFLVYRYQKNGSLLHVLENYADGKRDFPWRLRVSIVSGIARGLDYIYRKQSEENIPHGNIKLSNILLGENEEPLISEYGFQKYIDPKRAVFYYSNGYRAPEKFLTEKADVFSFGIVLLVLLTGKTIERTGIDLPKWVKSMVREEWTGEVFDKEVNKVGKQWAFPLLNISLKCISELPEKRPNMAEVLDKIEEVVNAQDDHSFSSISSVESNQQDGSLLHTVIPEGWETPGSNY